MSINFNPQDPLRLLIEEVVFPQGRKGGQHDDEEEKEDRERLLQIWKDFFRFEEAAKKGNHLILKKPLLKSLAKKLNSSVLQDEIYEKIIHAKYGSAKEQAEGEVLIKNLESINAKIDKANSKNKWFLKIPIPLFSRLSSIEKINIPSLLK